MLWVFLAPRAFASLHSYPDLHKEITHYLQDKKATVGVAVRYQDSLVIAHNDALRFPMMSVFKFPIALAVLDKMDREQIALDHKVTLMASQIHTGTHSPLRERYPDQDVTLTLGELIEYTVALSDNNTCDFLIDYAGGTQAVQEYVRNLGIRDFTMTVDEEGMHQDIRNQYLNTCTPSGICELFARLDGSPLFAPHFVDFIRQTLQSTPTGADKLKGLLPAAVTVGHKTGSSDRTNEGLKIADNDAGVVILPDGTPYYITVFVMDSWETDTENASIIAHLSLLVYNYLSKRNLP